MCFFGCLFYKTVSCRRIWLDPMRLELALHFHLSRLEYWWSSESMFLQRGTGTSMAIRDCVLQECNCNSLIHYISCNLQWDSLKNFRAVCCCLEWWVLQYIIHRHVGLYAYITNLFCLYQLTACRTSRKRVQLVPAGTWLPLPTLPLGWWVRAGCGVQQLVVLMMLQRYAMTSSPGLHPGFSLATCSVTKS